MNYNLFATWLINDCSVRTYTLSSILAQITKGKSKIELKSKLGYVLTILSVDWFIVTTCFAAGEDFIVFIVTHNRSVILGKYKKKAK